MWPWQMSGMPMNKIVMGNPLAVSILLSSLEECPGPLRWFEGIVWDSIQHKGGLQPPSVGRRVLAVHVTILLRTVLHKLRR